jgi:PAS domain S-box-containing protein
MMKDRNEQFLNQAIDFIQKIASGDFSARMEKPFENDECDALISGLNMLGEELQSKELEKEKQAATIKESETRFKELFDRMSSGVAVYDAINNGKDFIFKDLNKAAEDIDKIKKEDVIGKRLTKLFPDIIEFGLLEVMQNVWLTGKAQNHPSMFYKDDRIQGWRENHVYKLPNGEIVAVYNDVTERMEMEKELRDSEEMFRNMSDSIHDGLIMIDTERRISYWNNAAQRIFGYSYQEVINKDAYSLLAPKRYLEDYKKGFAAINKGGTGKTIGNTVQLKALKKDGKEIPIELSFSAILLKGKWHTIGIIHDITQRKKIELEIKTRRKYLEGLLAAAPDAIVTMDEKGKIVEWGNGAERMFGFTKDEAVGYELDKLVTNVDTYQQATELTNKVMHKHNLRSIEAVRHSKNNTPIDVLISGSPIYDGNILIGAVFIYTDISELKHAEQSVRENEEKYRSIVESTSDAIITLDTEGNIVGWNRGAQILFGYETDEILGKHAKILSPKTHETEQQQILQQTKKRGQSGIQETIRVAKDGRHVPVEMVVSARTNNTGRLTGTTASIRDCSERKQAEQKLNRTHDIYQKTIENARGVPYLLKFPEQKYEYFGSGIEKLLGIPADKMTSDMWKKMVKQAIVLDQDAPQDLKKYGDSFLDKEIQTYRVDIEIETATGERKWINDCSLPILDEKTGNVAASLGILQDISDRKRSEKKLEKLVAEKEMLLKEVYHRVKNNFALVSSLLNLQSHSIKDKKALETLNTSRDRIQSMAMVHQQLYQSVDLENINFKKYIESLTKTLFKSYVTDPGKIILEMKVDNLPIGADLAIPCGLIINELATNALKYAFDLNQSAIGKINIYLNQTNDREAELIVQDNGKGLPDNFNIEETESLGLKIVSLLVKQIGGSIDFQNSKGTKFVIKFGLN